MSSSSQVYSSRIISMDKAAKNCMKSSLKLANSVIALTGIAILMYSFWMTVVCLRHYQKYPFPWFLWACLGTGIILNFIACIGHAGADTKSSFLLSLYILLMFLLLLVEGLIIGDIWLNDHWYKDFPKDHTDRFHDFVDFVDDNWDSFKCLGMLIALSQIISLFLAMVLRTMGSDAHLNYQDEEVAASAKLPFLVNHPIQQPPPYAVGHPEPYYYPAVSAAPYGYTYGHADVAPHEKVGYEAVPSPQAILSNGC